MKRFAAQLGLAEGDERRGSFLVAGALAFVTYLLGAVVVFAGGGLGVDLAIAPLAIMMGLATVGEARLARQPTEGRRRVADRFVYIAAGYGLFLGILAGVVLLVETAGS